MELENTFTTLSLQVSAFIHQDKKASAHMFHQLSSGLDGSSYLDLSRRDVRYHGRQEPTDAVPQHRIADGSAFEDRGGSCQWRAH